MNALGNHAKEEHLPKEARTSEMDAAATHFVEVQKIIKEGVAKIENTPIEKSQNEVRKSTSNEPTKT